MIYAVNVFCLLLLGGLFSESVSQPCPPDQPPVNCVTIPCDTATCPRFPDAQCSNYNCGGCTAVFRDATTGNIIRKFSCNLGNEWPQCPRDSCNRTECSTGCPRVADALCSTNCNCRVVFSDRNTGDALSAKQCGTEFDERCPKPEALEHGETCENTICPRKCSSNQICCPTNCPGSSICKDPITCIRRLIPNMRYRCTKGSKIGTQCNLVCKEGYELVGINGTVCTLSGFKPSPIFNRCVRIECTRPKIPNMRFRCSRGNLLGSVCLLECKDGYSLIGVNRTECTAIGFLPLPLSNKCVRE